MTHILTLTSIWLIVLLFIIILYISFVKEQRILKFSRKPGRRIWYKVLTYHPLILPFLILMFVSSFVSVVLLREINIFDHENVKELIEVSCIIVAIYLTFIAFWIIGLQQKVKPMSQRKFNRTFSKVYKSNETLYDLNGLSYSARCKITILQIQLYSQERLTPKMCIVAREIFKDKFIVKAINPSKLKKSKKKELKKIRKHVKIQKKKLKKSSY